jgi:outer membrane receptor for ferrienterochelin and colicins
MTISSLTRIRTLSMALLIFMVGAGNSCTAQQSTPDLSEASLSQLGSIQVYSASMHLQPSGDAPSSVTVITSAEIQEQGYRTLADILRTVRSFYVTYDRNYSSLGVRGFERPGDYNTRILLLVDGHRMNNDVYDEAMIGTEFPIDVEMIQRIEIIRGPVSSLYGSNALFAVINIITRHAQDVNGLELSAETASFNAYKGRISYGHEIGPLQFLVSGSFYGSRGQNRLFFPEFDSPLTNNGIASHADDDQLGTALATISAHDFTLQAAYGTREKGIPTGSYGTIFNNAGTRTTDSHGYVDARYDHTFSGNWELMARLFYDRYTYQGTYMYPSPLDPAQLDPDLDFADGKWWGTQVQAAKTILKRNRITAGVEFRDNFREDQSDFDLNPYSLYLNDKRNSSITGIYFQDEVPITKSLALNAGIRYDHYSNVAASTDPRVALVYRPGSATNLKLIYGKAFRIPNVYEKYYSVLPNLPNPDLLPEKLGSTELVWEQSLSDRLWFSTSAFHITADKLISQQSVDNGLLIFRNVQNIESNGVELELKGRLPRGLEGVTSYSFQEAKDRDIRQFLNDSPRHLGKLSLIQPLLQRKLFASLNAQYRSGMTTFTGGSISPFSIVDFDVFGQKIGRHADLSVSLYNLLDKTYYDQPSTGIPESSIQQDGRTFRVKITWHLGEHR